MSVGLVYMILPGVVFGYSKLNVIVLLSFSDVHI